MSSWLSWSSQIFWVVMVGYVGGISDRALAQITPDETLGAESSVVIPEVIRGKPSDSLRDSSA